MESTNQPQRRETWNGKCRLLSSCGRNHPQNVANGIFTRFFANGQLRFSTPWLFGTPTRLSASLYNTKRSQQVTTESGYEDYIYSRKGGWVTVGRPITKNIDTSIRFKNEYISEQRPEAVAVDADEIGEILDRLTRSVTMSVSVDTRDFWGGLYHPVSGSLNSISYEYSGGILGAENHFQKYSAESSWFARIWNSSVLATHITAGYLNNQNSDGESLVIERYRLGGIDSIRGYNEWDILPINTDTDQPNYDGGNKMVFANFEYRIPLATQLTGVAFVDLGGVWDESTRNIFDAVDLKKGAGFGVRFNLMGMLARLEWGYGFDREVDGVKNPGGKVHFTLGSGF